MKERPILFSAPMVRAILAGAKTQTRRVMRKQFAPDAMVAEVGATTPEGWQVSGHSGLWWDDAGACLDDAVRCPYGQPGDRLWVRETFMHEPADYCWEASVSIPCRPASTVYRADFHESQPGEGWKPSIHMPRNLSRITLEVTAVRVERLQDISEADAQAEGIGSIRVSENESRWLNYMDQESKCAAYGDPRRSYRSLWEQINGPGSWDANPWVWVVEFKEVEP